MEPFIFGSRNGIHIVDLSQTVRMWQEAKEFVAQVAANETGRRRFRDLAERYGEPVSLVGHSLGGAAVLAAAAQIPEAEAVATIAAPADPAHVVGLLGDDLDRIDEAQRRVREAVRQDNEDVLGRISSGEDLSDGDREALLETIRDAVAPLTEEETEGSQAQEDEDEAREQGQEQEQADEKEQKERRTA